MINFSIIIHTMKEVILVQKHMIKLIKNIKRNIINIREEIDIKMDGMSGLMHRLSKIIILR
jgi:hypothetical protein